MYSVYACFREYCSKTEVMKLSPSEVVNLRQRGGEVIRGVRTELLKIPHFRILLERGVITEEELSLALENLHSMLKHLSEL